MADQGRGRGISSKTYWRVPGSTQTYEGPPNAKAVQYQEDRYENGDIVASRFDPGAGKWVTDDVSVDKDLAAAYRDAQRDDRAQAQEQRLQDREDRLAQVQERAANAPTVHTMPDGSLGQYDPSTKSWTTVTPAPTIVRSTNDPEAPNATERVPAAQATYDRQNAQDQYVRQHDVRQDALAQANAERAARLDELRNKVAAGELDLNRAVAEANRITEQTRLQLDAQANALTARGQDINGVVSQRGQDMVFQQGLVGNSTSLANTVMQNYVPADQAARIAMMTDAIAGGNRGNLTLPPLRPAPPPYDPLTFPAQAALAAQQAMPSRFVLPSVPQGPDVAAAMQQRPPLPSPFVLPAG